MCGHTVPVKGGIIIDMTYMNRIKVISVEDLYCIVEPGVIYDKLNGELGKRGFWFPATPGSGEACTIGGMVATNASGMRAIKYGATRDYVLGLEVVLPTGHHPHRHAHAQELLRVPAGQAHGRQRGHPGNHN